jgi:DNA-binding transcriptional LysR family regulator
MDMELRNLRVFVEVVRRGGFTEAAKFVFATQSTVSKSVKQLEDELGLRLLERAGTKPAMTAAGEIVYRRALTMLTERDDLVTELDELRGLKRGALRVGLPSVGSDALFAPIFSAFRSRHPNIDIRLTEGGSRHLEEVLRAGDVELAGLLQPVPEEFEWRPVRREPIVAIVSKAHPLARRETVDLDVLAAEPFILFDPQFAMHGMIIGACTRSGFSPNVVVESSQIGFMLELVAGGLGTAFMPKLIADLSDHKGVSQVRLTDDPIAWEMTLAWRKGGYLSQAATAWLSIAAETADHTD